VNTPSGKYLVELGVSIDPIDAVLNRLLDLLAVLLPVLMVCAARGRLLARELGTAPGRSTITDG
jgi:hypothetical protein